MKKLSNLLTLFIFPVFLFAQNLNFNTSGGFVAEGYDVVAYFSNTPTKGNSKYVTIHQGARFKFSSQANLNLFKDNPKKYTPQYGGYCAYAMGKSGEKVSIDPKTFEIRGDRLYLFYNAFFTNTFEKWKEEGAAKLQKQADQNWAKVKYKT